MKLPPLKKDKKTLLSRLGKVSSIDGLNLASIFVKDFMLAYTNILYLYFRKKGVPVTKVEFNSPRNRSLVYNWYKKMRKKETFPFVYESDADILKYKQVDFWKSALHTLLAVNSDPYIANYTQTTQGLFLYVQAGKFHADLRRKALLDSKNELDRKVISKLNRNDYLRIIAVYVLLLYEKCKGTTMQRNQVFYRYSGYIDYSDFPVFKKDLVQLSLTFRTILLEFEKFYYALIKYFNIEDYLNYPNLLEYISGMLVDNEPTKVFTGYSSNRIDHFVLRMIDLVMEDEW